MPRAGKFVRAPPPDPSELIEGERTENEPVVPELSEEEPNADEMYAVGRYVRAPRLPDVDQADEQSESGNPPTQAEYDNMKKRLSELEKVIADLSGTVAPDIIEEDDAVEIPAPDNSVAVAMGGSTKTHEGNVPYVRWDNIKPFPKGTPSNKMWEAWTRYIENFEIAASLSNAHDPVRRAQLLFLSVGDELQGIIRAAKLRPNENDSSCYNTFVKNIDQYLKSMTDTSAEHEAFANMRQERGESAVAFHARLQEKVWLCGYSTADQERFVRAQLLKGLANRDLAKAARTYGYETNFIVQSATRDEAYQAETGAVSAPDSAVAVNCVQDRDLSAQRRRRNENNRDYKQPSKWSRSGGGFKLPRQDRCSRCDRPAHKGALCPAVKAACHNCGRLGHFKATCRQRVNNLQEENMPAKVEEDTKDQQINALSLSDVLVDCRLGYSVVFKFLIDSGADVNVLGGDDWIRLQSQCRSGKMKLEPVQLEKARCLHAYASNRPMHIEYAFRTAIEVVGLNKPVVMADFLVVREGRRSLLGRSTASEMELLKVGTEVNSCEIAAPPEKFPKMPGVKVKFSIDKTVPSVRNAYYNVPAAYRDSARLRLQEMEERGIIERVTCAPTWISGMSAVAKGKDDFRLVVNMRAPNRAIKREYYRLPLLEEIKIKLYRSKYFTKLDLSNAFYHLELAEESRDLTTFLAEHGMFRFTRLMFGVNAAPEIFQREMERVLETIENKIVYIDDVLVFSETLEGLRTTVAKILEIFRRNNLTLNTQKCEYDKTHINFLGHHLDENGFHIEDSKIKSVMKFRKPSSSSELRSFLGLASFIGPYIKNFADISAPLWSAATGKTWGWGPQQDEAFELVKNRIIHCTATLGYFSQHDKTILYTDASPSALGAVLVQESADCIPRIISFASKALTETEKKYAQNQREALGAVWAVEHFSFYLLGRHFTLRTDAKGITFILNRDREDSKRALTRADGWALRLSPYRYAVEFVRGCDNIADPSSRLYCGNDDAFNDDDSPWEIASISASQAQFITESAIKEATARDAVLLKVMDALESDTWTKELHSFQTVATDLHNRDGIIVKRGCVIIPQELRKKTLEVAHEGHPLVAKFKSILRSRVWWPGIARDAEDWVSSCATCAVNGRPEKPTPMQRTFAPKTVWDTIAMDFNGPYARLGGVLILVIIDYRSRYALARAVRSTSFLCTKKVLDDIFGREGFPKAIKTDNGPPFNGEEYRSYCADRGIQTIYSIPNFPQQNGLAESFMKVVNKAMSTALSLGTNYMEELDAAVNAYNAASHSVIKLPPEEVMLGRKVRRGLPLLDPEIPDSKDDQLEERDRAVKTKSRDRENMRRGARPSRVKPGDIVIVERVTRAKGDSRFDSKRYTVSEERNGSLTLYDDDGQTLKRHVTQVKKVKIWRNPVTSAGNTRSREASPDGAEEAPTLKSGEPPIEMDHETSSRRPARLRKAPLHLKDYVKTIEEK